MTAVMFSLLGLGGAGLLIEMLACSVAPMGYQDENGFHLGPERAAASDEFENGNPS